MLDSNLACLPAIPSPQSATRTRCNCHSRTRYSRSPVTVTDDDAVKADDTEHVSVSVSSPSYPSEPFESGLVRRRTRGPAACEKTAGG